ncbi:MAG TPA: transposase, partial [Desulfobacteria bacterium]|nr:transposase [Desulfobacteria bacterium]
EGIPPLTTYALINWIFESPSRGYGFPFDRRHLEFYDRLKTVHGLLQNISGVHLRNKAKDNRSFIQLNKLLEEVLSDKELNNAASSMKKKAVVFDKLRGALRIAVPEGKSGLNDSGDETDMKTIEEKLGKFKAWLECEPLRKTTYIKMIDQMDKYWEKLFADPILVDTSEGLVSIAPQRTNNILERFFRGEKRRGRKKSGTVSLNKMLKTILADTPLVRNLEDQEYRKAILNGCASLAERFSQIDAKLVREKLKQAEKDRGKVPPALRKLIRQLDLFCFRRNWSFPQRALV